MNLMNLLFSYQGRINRAKLWLSILIYFIATFVMVLLAALIPVIGWLLAVVAYIAIAVSGVLVGIKRLHDRDKSGWWVLVFYVLPGILSGAGGYMSYQAFSADETSSAGTLLSLVSFAISLWGLVELGCLRGTIGPNQYGPDPIAPQPGH